MEGRALSSDILCRNGEEPECSGGCYPTQASTRVLVHYPRNCPGARRGSLPRCSEVEAGAHFLPSGYRVLWTLRVSWHRVVKELVNYPGAVKFIVGSVAILVSQMVQSRLGNRNKSKKCDKQLTHIVHVMVSSFKRR